MRRLTVITSLLSIAAIAACGGKPAPVDGGGGGSPSSAAVVTVAAFNFGESQVLANLFAAVLDGAGVPARVQTMTTREVVEPALWNGEVDVVPEYTSSLATFLNLTDNGPNAPKVTSNDLATTLQALRALAARHHVVVLTPSSAADENAFAVTSDFARANDLRTLSDLAGYAGPLALGGPAECTTRPYCQPGLEETYGITFTTFRSLDAGGPLTKLALGTGLIQVGLVFSSDPGIDAYHLTVLADDRHLQDVDVVVPVVNEVTAAANPKLGPALDALMATLTTADLMSLNAAVDLRHEDPATAARDYLSAKGLLPAT